MPRAPKKYHYLYKTTNTINGKFYVGIHSTDDLEDGYLGSGTYLWYSIRKYGKENFITEKLKFFGDRKSLIEAEEKFIDDTFIKNSLCMNLQKGGCQAREIDDTTRTRMSESAKNKIFTDKHKANISAGLKKAHFETPVSAETKTKIGAKHKGKILSDETKAKIAEGSRGNTSHKGFLHSEESKQKMAEASRGKSASAETRLKMSINATSRVHSEATKQRLSELNTGKILSDEHRQKLSESHKGHKPSGETLRKRSETMKLKYANGFSPRAGTKMSDKTKRKMAESQRLRREREHQI